MTGVEVMPTSGVINGHCTSLAETLLTPSERKLTFHKGSDEATSASKA